MKDWAQSARRADTRPFSQILSDGAQDNSDLTSSVAGPRTSRKGKKGGSGRARAYVETPKEPEYENLPKPKQAMNKKHREHMARKRQLRDCSQVSHGPAQGHLRAGIAYTVNAADIPLQYQSESGEETPTCWQGSPTCWFFIAKLCRCCAKRLFKRRETREREEERLRELRLLEEKKVMELRTRQREKRRLEKAAMKYEMRKREKEAKKEQQVLQQEVQDEASGQVKKWWWMTKEEKDWIHGVEERQRMSAPWTSSTDAEVMERQHLRTKQQQMTSREYERMAEMVRKGEKEKQDKWSSPVKDDNSVEWELDRQHQLKLQRMEMEHRFDLKKTALLNRHKEKMRELENQWKLQYDAKKKEMEQHQERRREMAKRREEEWLRLTKQQQNIKREVDHWKVKRHDVESKPQRQRTKGESTMRREQSENAVQRAENEHQTQMRSDEEKWHDMEEQLMSIEQRFEMEKKMAEERYEKRWKRMEGEWRKEWDGRVLELNRRLREEKQQRVKLKLQDKEQNIAKEALTQEETPSKPEKKETTMVNISRMKQNIMKDSLTETNVERKLDILMLKPHKEQNIAKEALTHVEIPSKPEKKETAMVEETDEETELEKAALKPHKEQNIAKEALRQVQIPSKPEKKETTVVKTDEERKQDKLVFEPHKEQNIAEEALTQVAIPSKPEKKETLMVNISKVEQNTAKDSVTRVEIELEQKETTVVEETDEKRELENVVDSECVKEIGQNVDKRDHTEVDFQDRQSTQVDNQQSYMKDNGIQKEQKNTTEYEVANDKRMECSKETRQDAAKAQDFIYEGEQLSGQSNKRAEASEVKLVTKKEQTIPESQITTYTESEERSRHALLKPESRLAETDQKESVKSLGGEENRSFEENEKPKQAMRQKKCGMEWLTDFRQKQEQERNGLQSEQTETNNLFMVRPTTRNMPRMADADKVSKPAAKQVMSEGMDLLLLDVKAEKDLHSVCQVKPVAGRRQIACEPTAQPEPEHKGLKDDWFGDMAVNTKENGRAEMNRRHQQRREESRQMLQSLTDPSEKKDENKDKKVISRSRRATGNANADEGCLRDEKPEKDLHSGCQDARRPVAGKRQRACEPTTQLEPEHKDLGDDWFGDMAVKNKDNERAEMNRRHQQRREESRQMLQHLTDQSEKKNEKDLHSGCQDARRPVAGRRQRACEPTTQLEPEHKGLKDDWFGDMAVKNTENERAEMNRRHQQRREESRQMLQSLTDQSEKKDEETDNRKLIPRCRRATVDANADERCLLEVKKRDTRQTISQSNEMETDWLCESKTKQVDSGNVVTAAAEVTRRQRARGLPVGNTKIPPPCKKLDDDWFGNTTKEDKWDINRSHEQSRRELQNQTNQAEQREKEEIVVAPKVRTSVTRKDAGDIFHAQVNKQEREQNTSEEWWGELRRDNQRKLMANQQQQETEVHVSKTKEQCKQLERHRTQPKGLLDVVSHTQSNKPEDTWAYKETQAQENADTAQLDNAESHVSVKCRKKTDNWFNEWMQTKKCDKKHDPAGNEKGRPEVCEVRRPTRENNRNTDKVEAVATHGLVRELQVSQVTQEEVKSNGRSSLWDSLTGELHTQPSRSLKEASQPDLRDISLYPTKRKVVSPQQQAMTAGHQRASTDRIKNKSMFEIDDDGLESITLEEPRSERTPPMTWTITTPPRTENTLDKNETPKELLNNSTDLVKQQNKQLERATQERERQKNASQAHKDDELSKPRKQMEMREGITEDQATYDSKSPSEPYSEVPLISHSSDAKNEKKNNSAVSAKEIAQPLEEHKLLRNTEDQGTLEKSPSLLNFLAASDEEGDDRSETASLSQYQRPEVDCENVAEWSVRRSVLKWVNKKAKDYYSKKIEKTFKREEEEGDNLYAPWYSVTAKWRSEREQEKRKKLLKAEERRQRFEASLLNWEAERAEKRAIRMEEEYTFEREIECMWFVDDLL